ncbi:MAG TPA: DUF1549 domain-containing protein, partial [Chthoniobacter sp.]|nr:DUF1549 domain-containing protein [Chthoniobacter sp.]
MSVLLATVFAWTNLSHAADLTTPEAMRLLKGNCFSCHNDQKKKGGLAMTSREALIKGGDNGTALDLKAPEKSALLEALAADADPHMPPKKQLAAAQIDTLKRWLQEGAKWDASALVRQSSAPRTVEVAPSPASYHPILALALSPDSSRLAVGGGNEVVIYDVSGTNLNVIARASAHPDPVQSIAWSPDGKRLATGAFRRVVIWTVEGLAKEREILEGLTDRIAALRFLPDGNQLVIADGRASELGTVRLADVGTGAIAASWTAHTDTVFDLAVSKDGKMLATAGGDKLVKLWDLETHKEIAKLEGHVAQVLSLAFNADGTQLASGGADFQLKVWDVKTHERIMSLGTHTTAVDGVAWATDVPAVVAVTADGSIERFTELKAHTGAVSGEVQAKEKKYPATEGMLQCVVVTPNGERLFAGSHDGQLFAYDKDGKLAQKLAVHETPEQPAAPANPAPSFMRDVLPVLSKAGCNAGACHAKPDGQNGFKLTVFSFDPKADYRNVTQDARGRRIFPAAPAESLLLLKATDTVPHEGGERFTKDSDAYRTIEQWIHSGMAFRAEGEPTLQRLAVEPATHLYKKGDTQQLKAVAHYSDGSTRDVTALAGFSASDKEIARVTDDGAVTIGKVSGQGVVVARFMGLVGDSQIEVAADHLLPATQYANLPVNNFIDELAYSQFKRLGLFPSDTCTDAEFLRRASLDTIGALPTTDEARAFLADTDPQKRDKLIDRLLANPLYADYWANKWADLLRPNSDRVGIKSTYLLDQWLRECFRANMPYDQFVRAIVTTE